MWSNKPTPSNPLPLLPGAGEPGREGVAARGGFTLLEVVIALAILAGTLVSLLALHQRNLAMVQRAGEITQATFLARESLAGLAGPDQAADLTDGEGTFPEEDGGPYRWNRQVEPTGVDGLLRIRLKVLWGEEGRGDFVEFTAYVAHTP